MSWQGVRVIIVTDRPDKTAALFFGRPLEFVPSWARIIDQPRDIVQIPDGATAIAFWHGARTVLQDLWIERGTQVRIVGDFFHIWQALQAWQERRRQGQGGEQKAEPAAQPPVPDAVHPAEPSNVAEFSNQRQPRWK